MSLGHLLKDPTTGHLMNDATTGHLVREQRAPVVTIGAATNVTSQTVTLNGTVNPKGKSTDYYFEYGLTTAYGSVTPTVSAGSGTSPVAVNASLTGLYVSTEYHFRLVATSSAGTTESGDGTLTTATPAVPGKPTVYIDSVSDIVMTPSVHSFILHGRINPNGAEVTSAYSLWNANGGTGRSTNITSPAGGVGDGTDLVDVEILVTSDVQIGVLDDAAYLAGLRAANSYGSMFTGRILSFSVPPDS